MCKHSSSGCPAPFQPAPTPTRTQKWTPIIFPLPFPAGPDTPRAEPGAAPADTAPALDAVTARSKRPRHRSSPIPAAAGRETLRPRLPTSRWQTDTRPASVGAGTSAKTSTTWAGAGGEATGGAVTRGVPSPHHPSGMGKLKREHQTRHGTHPGTPTALRGSRGCEDLQPGWRGCRLTPSHPCRHDGGAGHPVPSPAAGVPS